MMEISSPYLDWRTTLTARPRALTLCAVCLLGLLASCQAAAPVSRVQGKLTNRGQPVAQAVVIFSHPAQNLFVSVTTDAAGHFDTGHLEGGGLPIGTYQVAVQPPNLPFQTGEPLPQLDGFPEIPPHLLDPDRSGLEVVATAGTVAYNIELEPAE